ncbi:hypothetical protein [Paenisporosarcina indica]|uniref:hypothetical protein n=1 Tax=Paenisporosarcina indica TaxID=650093 RepID=UPI00094F91FE|nr:hypothetical protein [Paenisporosarcina indica]
MNYLSQYMGQIIEIEISGKKIITGKLIEYGSDIVVVFNGRNFFYVPLLHIIHIKKSENTENEIITVAPSPIGKDSKLISFEKTLTNALGIFVETYITGNQSIYGYITQIQKDYILFYSPAFKTLLIPITHLKWIVPHLDKRPYNVNNNLMNSSKVALADTFEEQIKKLIGEVVLFDLGKNSDKIGLIKNFENNMVELITGDGQTVFLNLFHIKSIHGSKIV